MDSVLSPNTSAFLNYLNTFSSDDISADNTTIGKDVLGNPSTNPTSLPPSAFFNSMPVPGRDTPEDTPPSAKENSVSPDKQTRALSVSDDSEDDASPEVSGNRRVSGAGANKRKVGQTNRNRNNSVDEEDEEDSDSDMSGHEDKRMHNDDKPTKSGKKGGRKSTSGEGKEPNKAARRKEQNRAAQKAFRERREAKVKDLEQKVAELEAKSYGASVENENLRGILKRLQEENISLKQSAFTFSMPVGGNGNSPNNNNNNNTSGTSPFSIPRPQTAKPPTPPLSSVDDGLKSINEISAPLPNGRMVDSPESLVSMNSSNGNTTDNSNQQQQQPDLLQSNAFNAFLFGNNNNVTANSNTNNNGMDFSRPHANPVQSRSDSLSSNQLQSFGTSSSSSVAPSSPSNQSDINALWASLYPQGVEALLADQSQQNSNNNQQFSSALYGNNVNPTPFTMLNSQPSLMSFADAGEQMWDPFNFMGTSTSSMQTQQQQFQQPQQQQQLQPQSVVPQQQQQPIAPQQQQLQNQNSFQHDFNRFAFRDPTSEVAAVADPMNNWNDITDNSVNEFLASLTGGGNNVDTDMNGGSGSGSNAMDQEDAFNAQLQQIFGGNSPSQLFNLTGSTQSPSSSGVNNPFSPTNYLNMSPSPLQPASNAQSPQSSVSVKQ
ncbi:hypothetical protein I302_105903 [Kwoniella bestiolae CBS 10118]|uniref:BZIP domain-containing protein n=1 Tax=Kwoniella bestiolae CBS 10118 TaxID=1296100 RepID=A0AAJ8K9Q9_9TREE